MNTTHTLLLGTALLCLSSCVSWHTYDKQCRATESALDRAAQTDQYAQQAYACKIENDSLRLRNNLLQTELTSTRRQYGQLDEASNNLLHRYDRYIAQTDHEVEANSSERQRLTEAALRREQEVRAAQDKIEVLNSRVKDQETRLSATRPSTSSGLASKAPTAYSEFQAPTAERAPVDPAAQLRTSKANAALLRQLQTQMTGFLPSELYLAASAELVTVEIAESLLFEGSTSRLSAMGSSVIRQLARALKGQELASLHIATSATTRSGDAVDIKTCERDCQVLAQALSAAGLLLEPTVQISSAPQPKYDEVHGGAVFVCQPGSFLITIVARPTPSTEPGLLGVR